MKIHASEIVLGILFAARFSAAAPATNSAGWMPVDQDVWSVLMEEPQAHLARAQEALANKDPKGAAKEIRRANTFLKIQEKRLAASSVQLSDLANDVETGRIADAKIIDEIVNKAVSALDQRQNLIPVMAGADTLYVDEANYHLGQAKSSWIKKDGKAAAGDIRKAAAYLKLKAVHAEEKTKSELLASAAELQDLALKVEAGTVTAAKDLDDAFARARKAVRGAL